MADAAYKVVRGVRLRQDPARDTRFTVVETPEDMAEFAPGTDPWRRESLHRHYNTEIQSLEIAAQSLVDFPDAPWSLRLDHARQCWDEARHADVIARQLLATGGYIGEFPIINFDWGVACAVETLAGRIALQNRTVEAGEMDLLSALRDTWRALGDEATAATMDGILADEIQHVRFANAWLHIARQQDGRVVLHIARAIDHLRTVTDAFTPEAGEANAAGVAMDSLDRQFATNVDDRRLAGLDDLERNRPAGVGG
jgi:uncharacterized ferritin-like protein (DUF455 family)